MNPNRSPNLSKRSWKLREYRKLLVLVFPSLPLPLPHFLFQDNASWIFFPPLPFLPGFRDKVVSSGDAAGFPRHANGLGATYCGWCSSACILLEFSPGKNCLTFFFSPWTSVPLFSVYFSSPTRSSVSVQLFCGLTKKSHKGNFSMVQENLFSLSWKLKNNIS